MKQEPEHSLTHALHRTVMVSYIYIYVCQTTKRDVKIEKVAINSCWWCCHHTVVFVAHACIECIRPAIFTSLSFLSYYGSASELYTNCQWLSVSADAISDYRTYKTHTIVCSHTNTHILAHTHTLDTKYKIKYETSKADQPTLFIFIV